MCLYAVAFGNHGTSKSRFICFLVSVLGNHQLFTRLQPHLYIYNMYIIFIYIHIIYMIIYRDDTETIDCGTG